MDNRSKSSAKDPAALAFSAVENALRESVFSIDEADRAASEGPDATPHPDAGPEERSRTARKIAGRAKPPANDDRFAANHFVQTMQSNTSAAPLWTAAALSVLWMVAIGYVGWLRFGEQIAVPSQWGVFLTTSDFVGLLALTVLPAIGFFAVAVLARRAQDLRVAATSMTRAAMRLAEPETTAADKVASVGQAVRREVNALGDGLERALSRAGELEVMVHNEVTSLERTYSDNEIRLRSLIQELAAQRESVITNADRVREAIGEAHTAMIGDIDRMGERFAGTVADRGKEIRSAVETASNEFDTAFSERSDNFAALVDKRTNDLVAAMDSSAERLNTTFDDRATLVEDAFDKRTGELSKALDGRIDILTAELDSRAISLSQAIDQKTANLAGALKDGGSLIVADLESRGYAVNDALEAVGSRIVNDIGSQAGSAERALTGIANRLDETMSIRLNSLDSRLQTALLEIDGAMAESTEKAGATLSNAGAQTLQQFDARAEEVSLIIDSRLAEVDAVVGGKGEKIIEALNTHTEHFTTSANILETALDEKTAKLDDAIKTNTNVLNAEISARTKEFAEKLGSRSQQLSEVMSTRTREFGDALDQRTQKLSETLDSRTREFDNTLDSRTQQMSEALSTETGHMSEKLKTSANLLADTIRSQTGEIGNTIDAQGEAMRARVDDAMAQVTDTMEGRASHVSAIITSKIAEVNEAIGREVDTAVNRLSDAESGVTARIDSAAGNISESAQHAAQMIEGGIDAARLSITDMVDQRLGTLPEAITARADITADRLAGLNESISATLSKSMGDLEASADQIEETIGSRIASASLTISNDVEKSAERMDVAVRSALEQIKEASRHIEDLVEVRALETANRLGEKVEDMNRAVTEHGDSFSALITQRSAELESALNGHGNILRDALSAAAHESEEIMSQSSSRILDDVTTALKKLNDGNLLLQRVLETSTANLAQLESSVATHTTAYSDTVRDAVISTEQAGELITHHVSALETTIGSMVNEFGSLLGNLDTETASINNAADALNNAGNLTIDTLENRRDAMEALVSSFTARADEIDERMRLFAQSISDTVNDTEHRLGSARSMMEETLSSTTETITERIESISHLANDHGQHAGESVRQVQEALLREMQSAFEEATQRFTETAEAMRLTANQVGTELEATRSELQRGVVELPEETRASAAAMRRVVAEQIEALNELNTIVRSQPGTHDVSSRRRNPPQQRSDAPLRLRDEPGSPEVPPAPRATRQQPVDEPSGRAAVAALMRSQQTPREQQHPGQNPSAPRGETLQAPRPGALRDDGNGSWLRDVLRNASAKQQEVANQQKGRGVDLSNLTGDVARAVDEAALNEAWQRYRGGEQNVFSRRIYTLTGQGTYDEVRKKLQRDPDFAETANAYMDEFEQLLTKAASDPRSATSTEDHLVSDRGKVYAMLAHASGRLN